MPKKPKPAKKEKANELKKLIDDENVAVVVLVGYEGDIDTYTVEGRGNQSNPSGNMPAGNIGSGTLKFAIEQTNPRCVWVDINGDLVKICKG